MDTMQTSRLLAVCDLLAEPATLLEPGEVARTGAEHIARLAGTELGIVIIDGPGGLVTGAYPRAIGRKASLALLEVSAGHRAGHVMDASWLDGAVHTDEGVRAVHFEAAGRFRGVVAAVSPISGGFTALEEWLVIVSARRFAAQLELIALHQDRLAEAQIVSDVESASEMQRSLLPQAESSGHVDIAGIVRPARIVAGDLYDWRVSAQRTIAAIADVSGKGSAAAMMMGSVRAAFQHTRGSDSPTRILTEVGSELWPVLDRTSRNVTMAAATYRPAEGSLRVASAGHSPVIVKQAGNTRSIAPTGVPFGVPGPGPEDRSFEFAGEDLVVLASDGLVEQTSENGDQFGIDRLLEAVSRSSGSSHEVARSLIDAVDSHGGPSPQQDDQTVLVLRANAAAS
ncbi:MAG: serine/threonine-protein phosphatase [Acidimicrobiia bacterium]|nr:serine/threonine-protein phosphatase [Acidimicrobiia bacterium]